MYRLKLIALICIAFLTAVVLMPILKSEVYVAQVYEDDFTYMSLAELEKKWLVFRKSAEPEKTLVLKNRTYLYLINSAKDTSVSIYLKGIDLRKYIYWRLGMILKIVPTDKPSADGMTIAFFHEAKLGLKGGELGIMDGYGYFIEFDIFKNDIYKDLEVPYISLMYKTPDHGRNEIYRYGHELPILDRWLYVVLEFYMERSVGNTIVGILKFISLAKC